MPPDLEVKAQHNKNGVSNLPFKHKEGKRELKVQPQQRNPVLLLRVQIFRSNVGQDAHLSPTPRVALQKLDITCRALDVACWL